MQGFFERIVIEKRAGQQFLIDFPGVHLNPMIRVGGLPPIPFVIKRRFSHR